MIFDFTSSFQKIKASRIDRFRNNLQDARKRVDFQESHLDFCEREFAKWTNPEAFHIGPGVLKDADKAIKTKDFHNAFVAKRQASALASLEEAKERLAGSKSSFETCEQKYAEELKFENETFEEFKARTAKENSNG